jgi:DNA replication protein DnaC
VSSASRPVRLASAGEASERACPLGVCDGSGWILGPEDVARPCECRERRMARRRARGVASAIPRKYRTLSFESPPITNLSPGAVGEVKRYLGDLEANLAAGKGVWFYGDVGTGKTSLAMLISKEVSAAGRSVAVYSLPKLLARIRRTYDSDRSDLSYLEFVERLTSVDVLHLDDVGAEKRTDWVLEQLYAIVNERYESQRSVLVTSNLDESKLKDQIGERTVSRLVEICSDFMIPLFGNDLRYPGG